MNIIELVNIRKSYGNHVAVDGLTLQVPSGSIYGFIGPNGSGKTTIIRMIMNILYPDSGSIRIFRSTIILQGKKPKFGTLIRYIIKG